MSVSLSVPRRSMQTPVVDVLVLVAGGGGEASSNSTRVREIVAISRYP
jgi:hypothetical protein